MRDGRAIGGARTAAGLESLVDGLHARARSVAALPLLAAFLGGACGSGGGDQAERAAGAESAAPSAAAEVPAQRDPAAARRAAAPGDVLLDASEWHWVDDDVETRGLDVRFEDGDGRDEVHIWEGDPPYPLGGLAPHREVRLTSEWQDVRVEFRNVAFEVRVRGTGKAVGGVLVVGAESDPEDPRLGGKLELEDESAAGAWIEVAYARLVRIED